MTWESMRENLSKIVRLVRRTHQERDLSDELAFHLAMKEQKYVEDKGLSPQHAAQQANRDLGGLERWKEICRDVTRWRFLEESISDLMLSLRMLRKTPVFTAVALVTLTAAIGANTAIFSLMNAILLKSLAVPEASRLAILRVQPGDFGYSFTYPLYKQLLNKANSELQAFAFVERKLSLRRPSGTERVAAQLVGGQYFAALGVQPKLGRWIGPNDDQPGAPNGVVAVISDRFWRNRLNNDPQVLGRKITFNQGVFTVIGVMPNEFRGIDKDEQYDVFLPFELEPLVDAPFNNIALGPNAWWFHVGASFKEGVSIARADTFLRTRSPAMFQAAWPSTEFEFNGHKVRDLYLVAEPGRFGYSSLRLQFRKPLSVLMLLVGLVLLVACLNMASLLMARASSRTRELTTRFALGATRARLLRQLLTESFVLVSVGTVLGFLASPILTHLMIVTFAAQHDPLAAPLDVSPDLRLFAFTAAIAIVATIVTASLPALRSTENLQGRLRGGSASLRSDDRRHLWPRVLLGIEVSVALMLVAGASLLGVSLLELHQVPMGFNPQNLICFPVEMGTHVQGQPAALSRYRNILNSVSGLASVTDVSVTAVLPLGGSWGTSTVNVPGKNPKVLWASTVGPNYFQTMHTRVLEGREFRWTDTASKVPVSILNQAAARQLFPQQSAIGRRITFDGGKTLTEVAAVVGDAKYSSLRDASPPTFYLPFTQDLNDQQPLTILVRTTGPASPLVAAVSQIITRAIPDMPPPAAFTMEQTIAEDTATERLMTTLALFFGGLALLITGIGLFGTLAYTTERRTGEIGIRLALGARQWDVIAMVCSENGAIALIGCAVGIVGSLAASKLIASFLYGVSPRDPLVFGAAALLLLSVATAASLIPALKAARTDPLTAIRHE